MAEAKYTADHNGRIVQLIQGANTDGTRFWIYIAIIPGRYETFLAHQNAGTLDLFNLEVYGEILSFGAGDNPPQTETEKVAKMYQTNPAKMFQVADPMAEVNKKIEELNKNWKSED